MCRPPLPTTTPPKHARRPEWDLTALAQLSAEQSHLRSFPTHFPTKGRWLKLNGSLELPRGKFQAKNGADTPTIDELLFTRELHAHLHNRFHQSGAAIFRKQKAISGEQAGSRNAAKTSDEAGATPAFDARRVTAFHGVAPASLTVKIETLDGEEFVCTGSRDGFAVKKVRFSFCTSEIATSSPCRKRISWQSKNLGENAKAKIASEKTKNWAGATPLFWLRAAQKVLGVAPAQFPVDAPTDLAVACCGWRSKSDGQAEGYTWADRCRGPKYF
jgi:hypothetical protein